MYNSKIKLINDDILSLYKGFEDSYFDLIISNPPYIESGAMNDLQPEVLWEPRMALDGGKDGLEFYLNICKLWISKLKIGGTLAFEIGQGQHDAVADIMKSFGITNINMLLDINNIFRVVVGNKSKM